MLVLTIDQRGSRRDGDRVPELLRAFEDAWPGIVAGSPAPTPEGVALGFERTVGDEVQGVLEDGTLAVALTLRVLRTGGWSVGIGCGRVDEPLAETSRAASGTAFVLARDAVEAAKSRQRVVPFAVRGAHHQAGLDAEAVLTLVAATAARRTTAGWEAVDAVDAAGPDARQEDVASAMGITQQAVSQRLRTALYDEARAASGAAARLLLAAQG
ncbi:hypothetical protein [Cellulomonas palmilytica]|uniref:hypothetical protein n=1 Tax=Cellulomonas palmilytica TaxID=2608402 RepID=UPI001F339476|nr:hypothetical protein [Cellulomonas palmilytica]UJP38945.1 hypothetical protein F1D97_11230 [Cellulomonas palmilytica]